MESLKTIYFYLGYTLYFYRWLVIGRVAMLLLVGSRRNVLVDFFVRFTQPLYDLTKKVFPFTRVPPERQGTAWGTIEGSASLVIVALLWVVEKALRVVVSYIILN